MYFFYKAQMICIQSLKKLSFSGRWPSSTPEFIFTCQLHKVIFFSSSAATLNEGNWKSFLLIFHLSRAHLHVMCFGLGRRMPVPVKWWSIKSLNLCEMCYTIFFIWHSGNSLNRKSPPRWFFLLPFDPHFHHHWSWASKRRNLDFFFPLTKFRQASNKTKRNWTSEASRNLIHFFFLLYFFLVYIQHSNNKQRKMIFSFHIHKYWRALIVTIATYIFSDIRSKNIKATKYKKQKKLNIQLVFFFF